MYRIYNQVCIKCYISYILSKNIICGNALSLKAVDEKKRALQDLVDHVPEDGVKAAEYFSARVNPVMEELRTLVDECESLVDEREWPAASYGRMLTQRAK